MARIKDASVEAVKSAAEILPLVEDYVRLRKAGGTYKGLCPFHQEQTPSFTVSPARGTYKCFGCGEGGDAISFVEKLEHARLRRRDRDARAALRRRDRVRGDLARGGPRAAAQGAARQAARARDRVLRARALGQRAGRVRARVPRVARARRGGLPRRSGSATRPAARRSRGARCRRASRAGRAARGRAREPAAATTTSSGGSLFPLADARGRVRGFQARKLYDDDPLQAKYVNSPESDLFKQGRPALRPRHRRGSRSRRRTAPSSSRGTPT